MARVRVLDKPEDYKRLGLNPDHVEQWEDGRRSAHKAGVFENIYFDSIMDDGTKAVVNFLPHNPRLQTQDDEDHPNLNIHITTPDGKTYTDVLSYTAEESSMSTEKCDFQFGPNSFVGDLKEYDIHVEPVNGVGADLHFSVGVKPFRPGTGYVEFDEDPDLFYTWLVFPSGKVTGTVTAGGKTWEVSGTGYHDHQWPSTNVMNIWHHWLWGRQTLDNYIVLIFDLVANAKYDFERAPIFAVLDKKGNVVFENLNVEDHEHKFEIIERHVQEQTGKTYPKDSRYTFKDHGKTIVFDAKWTQELEVRDAGSIFAKNDPKMKEKLHKMGLDPTYTRYQAEGTLSITDENGHNETDSGDMIYEFPYLGLPDDRAQL
ncbi:hypothetical protein [Ligilactobacillus acidipiscis]|uniref:hypothetical protein n=1 Tax=Ligilactobacillus acidipiscis TaxID=89059 RepID=UPI0023F7E8D0|nr:hypothetical protein [Ligilactobacillus acidipiscis]WEV57441.1 hypothetical protein OZX66_02535 [Ligilactobacillus acidipiscis]